MNESGASAGEGASTGFRVVDGVSAVTVDGKQIAYGTYLTEAEAVIAQGHWRTTHTLPADRKKPAAEVGFNAPHPDRVGTPEPQPIPVDPGDEPAAMRRYEGTGPAERTVKLTPWTGTWSDDDPDANFKADVALYSRVDALTTIHSLAEALDVPEGAIVWYVLAKWASAGSGGLLKLGPSMVGRLWEPIEQAEQTDTDVARLDAYAQLRQMLSWLRFPLTDPDVSGY